MIFVPIFIHHEKKSDKEIREEIEQEREWRKMIENDERREEERLERLKIEKKIEAERKLREWANEEEYKNPNEWRVCPMVGLLLAFICSIIYKMI